MPAIALSSLSASSSYQPTNLATQAELNPNSLQEEGSISERNQPVQKARAYYSSYKNSEQRNTQSENPSRSQYSLQNSKHSKEIPVPSPSNTATIAAQTPLQDIPNLTTSMSISRDRELGSERPLRAENHGPTADVRGRGSSSFGMIPGNNETLHNHEAPQIPPGFHTQKIEPRTDQENGAPRFYSEEEAKSAPLNQGPPGFSTQKESEPEVSTNVNYRFQALEISPQILKQAKQYSKRGKKGGISPNQVSPTTVKLQRDPENDAEEGFSVGIERQKPEGKNKGRVRNKRGKIFLPIEESSVQKSEDSPPGFESIQPDVSETSYSGPRSKESDSFPPDSKAQENSKTLSRKGRGKQGTRQNSRPEFRESPEFQIDQNTQEQATSNIPPGFEEVKLENTEEKSHPVKIQSTPKILQNPSGHVSDTSSSVDIARQYGRINRDRHYQSTDTGEQDQSTASEQKYGDRRNEGERRNRGQNRTSSSHTHPNRANERLPDSEARFKRQGKIVLVIQCFKEILVLDFR